MANESTTTPNATSSAVGRSTGPASLNGPHAAALQKLFGTPIASNFFRALAEAADAFRNTPACLVETTDPDQPYQVIDKKDLKGETVVLEFMTTDKQSARPVVELNTTKDLLKEDGSKFNINDCDAVFTTLSAVEKFLVPYYSRMRTLDRVLLMRDKFEKSPVSLLAFHLPSSYEGRALDGGVQFAEIDQRGTVQVKSFAEFTASP